MSYLQKQMSFLRFDKRLLELNLKTGTITQEEYNQHIQSLQDMEGRSEKLRLSSDSKKEDLNGSAHKTSETVSQPQSTPATDPFGSGY